MTKLDVFESAELSKIKLRFDIARRIFNGENINDVAISQQRRRYSVKESFCQMAKKLNRSKYLELLKFRPSYLMAVKYDGQEEADRHFERSINSQYSDVRPLVKDIVANKKHFLSNST